MSVRIALRLVAILIAVGAMIDPALAAREAAAIRVVAIRLVSGAVNDALNQLRAAVPAAHVVVRDPAGRRVPCAPDERCVLVADGSIDAEVPADAGSALALIRVPVIASPNVAIRRVEIPRGVHVTAAASARVELSGTGVAGGRTEVRVMDDAVIAGSAVVEWPGGATSVTLEIPFWPITPAGVVRIEAMPAPGETIVFDNTADAGVPVERPVQVLMFDTRPSWSSTFVRRALQDDPRFIVNYRTAIAAAPRAIGTAADGLSELRLELAEVVIAGGVDTVSARDAGVIDRFVRQRGGTLILLPDRLPTGEAGRLMPGEWREQLLPAAERVGPLPASEILRAERLPFGATTLARHGDAPVIVSIPRGEGRVIVSGAMDAWRHRHADGAVFDRFWRSIVAEAGAASRGLQIDVDRSAVAAGARVPFTMRHRTMAAYAALEAKMFVRCGDSFGRYVRVWPSGGLHAFAGEIPSANRGPCTVIATTNMRDSVADIAVAERPRPSAAETLTNLERAVVASGGVIADAGDAGRIARAIAESAPPSLQAVTIHPMRSPWWIVPFVACLSIEWWLRRRQGLH